MEQSIERHLERVRNHLLTGRATLRLIRESDARTYDVPDVTVDRSIFHRHIPEDNDKSVDIYAFLSPRAQQF
jgi:hypothetical protein